MQLTVPVAGMTCQSCELRVGRSLRAVPGVESVSVSAARGRATVRGRALPPRERLEAAVRSAGYQPLAPPWLSTDPSVWWTFAATAAVVGLAVLALSTLGLGGIADSLVDPSRGGLVLVLLLGLAAGVSTCMAIVGGLVLSLSAAHASALRTAGPARPRLVTRLRPQLAFNLGRVVGFALLGGALGALGSTMSLPTRVLAVLVLAVAVVMVLVGVRLSGVSPRTAGWSPRLPGGLGRALGLGDPDGRSYGDGHAALLGAATFVLPCGFTQATQLYALSTGSAPHAALIMATFAVGTTPGLLAVATVPEVTTGPRQVTVLRSAGVVVLAFALLNLGNGLSLLGITGPGSAVSVSATASASPNVSVADGRQTVRMTQTSDGYEPATTVLYSGLPTTWVIEGTSPFSCSAALRVPDLGVAVNLTEGANSVDLPALDAGEVPFTCIMGMYSGTLVVVDPPTAPSS